MSELSLKIGKRIHTLRKQKEDLSQEKLANKAEIDRTYMTDLEIGNRKVSVEILEKVVKALEIDLSEFFNDEMFRYEK
jgi:transcriptional regulator with XRE-family HTH domain